MVSLLPAAAVLLAAAPVAAQPAEPSPEISGPAAQVAIEATGSPTPTPALSEVEGPTPTPMEEEGEGIVGLTLEELVELAGDHPLIGAAEAELQAADARLEQAWWAPFSNWTFSTSLTFVPPIGSWDEEWRRVTAEGEGDVLWNTSILDWGPWIRIGVSGGFPLYTFGKLMGVLDAAEAGVRASEAGVRRAERELVFQVRRAYFTLLLAREILYLIDDGRGYIDDAREEVERRIESGEGGGATLDLYKIDALAAEVDARELQAIRMRDVAEAGLRLLAGLEEGVEIADLPLAEYAIENRPLAEYREMATEQRPDLRMLDAAIEAQQAKVDIEWARYFPDIGVTGQASYAYSSVVEDQHHAWISDPFNGGGVGAALVVQYPLDFGMDHARVEEAEATLRRLLRQRAAAGQGAQAEVADAFGALVEARGRVEAWDRGRLAAKRWLISVLQGMTLGLHEASDMTDGLVAYFQNELNWLNAIYDLDVAWSRLELAAGGDFLSGAEFSD